jgi:hypothetical protein
MIAQAPERITLATSLALALVIALAASVSAGEQRPFQTAFSGQGIEVAQRCGPNALTIGFAVSGTATHLGAYSGTGSNCTGFTLLTEAVDIWDGVIELHASDGSTLSFTSSGSQGAPSGGKAAFTQSLTVASGTGRLSGASGELAMTGIIDFTQIANGIVKVEGKATGWLDY